jgi:hypothetical protein
MRGRFGEIKISIELFTPNVMAQYAGLCGQTLALAQRGPIIQLTSPAVTEPTRRPETSTLSCSVTSKNGSCAGPVNTICGQQVANRTAGKCVRALRREIRSKLQFRSSRSAHRSDDRSQINASMHSLLGGPEADERPCSARATGADDLRYSQQDA